jgi:hypothetical protein
VLGVKLLAQIATDLQPLMGALAHRFTWVPALMTFMGGARLLMKWVSGPLQAKLTARMAQAATGPDQEEERDWETVLRSRKYRVASFILDMVCSFKLPTLADFLQLKNKSTTNGHE